MVVTSGIERAIQYYHAIRDYLAERKSPYRAIVAFSGEHEYGGVKVTEASLNGFPSSQIADRIQEDPYRFLDLRRQVPDRLRRAAAAHDVRGQGALRHQGGADALAPQPRPPAEARRLRARLHERRRHDPGGLRRLLPHHDPRARRPTPTSSTTSRPRSTATRSTPPEQVDELVELYLGGADRDRLDPILDACVAVYKERLDEDGQVDFKGKAKAFVRTYGFLASILPYTNAEWEKLSIFLNFLVPKLPAPVEEDLSKGILEAIDMDSYRVEKQAAMQHPACRTRTPRSSRCRRRAAAASPSRSWTGSRNILKAFNDQFGNIAWTDADRVQQAHHRGDPGQGGGGHGLPEREAELRQAERPHRARQGAGARDDGRAQGRHRAVQAVQRQRVVPALADGHGVRADVRHRGGGRLSKPS